MSVICWFSTYWPFSPSLMLLHNSSASLMNVFLVISNQGGVPPKLSQCTLSKLSPSSFLLPSWCTQTSPYMVIWMIVGITWCACASVVHVESCKKLGAYVFNMFPLVAIYMCMLLCVGLSFAADIWDSMYNRMPACSEQMWTPACVCVCTCVRSRCPVFCSVPQTGWSLLLLPRADGPGHVLLCLQGQATPPLL